MARTWFANPPAAQMVLASKDTKGAVPKKGDPAQSIEGVSSTKKIAVNGFAPVHQTTPTKAVDSVSYWNGFKTCVTPFSSPQNELNTEPTKEAIDASANLAKLIRQHSKTTTPQMAATSRKPTTSKPVEMIDTPAPSSSAPRRAPTAQMVALLPNAAVTTTPAGAATSETSPTSLFGPRPSPMSLSSPQVFFAATASSSLPVAPTMPSSSTAVLKKSAINKSTPKKPRITITPAPVTALNAFKDAALAAHVQNAKLLSPAKSHTNSIKKRQHIRISSPPESVSTPESVPKEKRRRGRPRTLPEEQSLLQNRQYRPPVQPSTPFPRTCFSNQSNSSPVVPSTFPLQQTQAVTSNVNGVLNPIFCSEEPRLWPGCGDHVTSLLRFNSRPETAHSEPIQVCANHAAHQDLRKPHGHGVCTTCHHSANRHIRKTRPELLGSAWWPLCKACSDNELLHTDPKKQGCSCGKAWLCFSCQMLEVERRNMKNIVEAEFRRRIFVGEGMDGDVKTVFMGWACECGGQIGPNATMIKCIGCQGMAVGKLNARGTFSREMAWTNTALAWT